MKQYQMSLGGLFVLIALIFVGGCGQKPTMVTTNIPDEEPQKRKIFEYRSSFHLAGGGIATVVGLTGGTCTAQIDGQLYEHACGTEIVISGINPDRLDVLGGAVIRGATGIVQTKIFADAQVDAAKKSGPGIVLIQNQRQGQSSSAFAGQETDVDIGIKTDTPCTGANCNNNNNFDPR